MEPRGSVGLRAGSAIVFVVGLLFAVVSVGIAVTPLPGEEAYAGTTFEELKAANPRLANVIWHDYVAFGILLLGVSLLTVLLAWQGLSKRSRLAWTSLTVIGGTVLAFLLLAHLPIGHDFSHYGPLLFLDAALLLGLAISAKSVLRSRGEGGLT